MITVSLGSHRFEAGPTYYYNGARVGELLDTIREPGPTTDYINILRGINASPDEVQQVAAAGVVRLSLRSAERTHDQPAIDTLLAVCRGEANTIPEKAFSDRFSWDNSYALRGSLTNELLDSASVLATRLTNTAETTAIIENTVGVDEGVFVIGLANGSIISAARTFVELAGGDNKLTFVQYSRNKSRHTEPYLFPCPQPRVRILQQAAKDRRVVVHDEDYATDATLRTAVSFFAQLLGTRVVGIAPVKIGHRIEFDPLVIQSE